MQDEIGELEEMIGSMSIFMNMAGPPLDRIPSYVDQGMFESKDPYLNGLYAVLKNVHAYNGLPDEVKLIPDVARALVSKSAHSFFRLDPQLQKDRTVVWYAVCRDPSILGNESISDEFRGDAALVTRGILRRETDKYGDPQLDWLGNVDWDVLGEESFLIGLQSRIRNYYSNPAVIYQLLSCIACKLPLAVFKNDVIALAYFKYVQQHALIIQLYTGYLSSELKGSPSVLKVLHERNLLIEGSAADGSVGLLNSVPPGTFLDRAKMVELFGINAECVKYAGQRLWTDGSFVRDMINEAKSRHQLVDFAPILMRASIDILDNTQSFLQNVLEPMASGESWRNFEDNVHPWIASRISCADVLYKVADVINGNLGKNMLLDSAIHADGTKRLLCDASTMTEFFKRLRNTYISDRQGRTLVGYLGIDHIPLHTASAIVATKNDSSATISLVLSKIDPSDMNRMCLFIENYDCVEEKAPDGYGDDGALTSLCETLLHSFHIVNAPWGEKLETYEKSETDPWEINTEEKERQFNRRHFVNMLLKGREVDSRVRILQTFMKLSPTVPVWNKIGRRDVWDHSAALRRSAMLSGTSDSHEVYSNKATEIEKNDVEMVLRMMMHPDAELARRGQHSSYAGEIAIKVPNCVREDVRFARKSILYFGKVLEPSDFHTGPVGGAVEGATPGAGGAIEETTEDLSWRVEKRLLEIAYANHNINGDKATPYLNYLRCFFHDLWVYDVTDAESESNCLARKRSMKPKHYTRVLPENYAINTIEERKKHADMLSTWMAAINEICRDIHTNEDVVVNEETGSERIRRSVTAGTGVFTSPAITALANRIYTFMARESGQVVVMDILRDLYDDEEVTEDVFTTEQARVATVRGMAKKKRKAPIAPAKRLRVTTDTGMPSTSAGTPLDSDDDD